MCGCRGEEHRPSVMSARNNYGWSGFSVKSDIDYLLMMTTQSEI